MKRFRRIEPTVYVLGLAGSALFVVLLIREGAQQVGLAIARVGWGLLAITLFHLVQTLSDAAGWLALIPKQNRVRLISSFFLHWLGESINNLLLTGRVGGDIVVARVAAIWGMPLRVATGAVVVDITIGIITKVIFIVASSILLVAATGRTDLTRPALVAVLTGTLAVVGFYAVQRAGIFRWSATFASRLAKSPSWDSLVQGGEALDQTIRVLYTRHRGLVCCGLFWTLSWLIRAAGARVAIGLRHSGDVGKCYASYSRGDVSRTRSSGSAGTRLYPARDSARYSQ